MAAHVIIVTWEIPWTEEPGRLQSMDLQRSQIQLSYETTTIYMCVCIIFEFYIYIVLYI